MFINIEERNIVMLILSIFWLNFGLSIESSDSNCKIETTFSEDSLHNTICVTYTDSYRSEINITCPDSWIIGLRDVIIGIREGCSGKDNNFSCCSYQVSDTLIDGRCLRQNSLENAGLYDRVVESYLNKFSGKTGGIFRYGTNVRIPASLGYSENTSSYIIFKYQCKATKSFITSEDTKGNGTRTIDITSSRKLKIKDAVYLGTKRPELAEGYNDSSIVKEYKCVIHADSQSTDIKIDVLDIRFHISDSSKCNGSSLIFVDIKNNVTIYQQDCNSWFSPFNMKIASTLGVLVLFTVEKQLLEETSIWLEITSSSNKKVEIHCGDVRETLEELLDKQQLFAPFSAPVIVCITIGTIAVIILVIFVIVGVKIWYRKTRIASGIRGVHEEQKCPNVYDYSTISQSIPLKTADEKINTKRDTYDKVENGARNDTYDTLNDNASTNNIDDNLASSEVDDNYDHFTAIIKLNAATLSSDYAHIPCNSSIQ